MHMPLDFNVKYLYRRDNEDFYDKVKYSFEYYLKSIIYNLEILGKDNFNPDNDLQFSFKIAKVGDDVFIQWTAFDNENDPEKVNGQINKALGLKEDETDKIKLTDALVKYVKEVSKYKTLDGK